MEKYKIKDLLLIYESGDCRFGVLNNKKTKITGADVNEEKTNTKQMVKKSSPPKRLGQKRH